MCTNWLVQLIALLEYFDSHLVHNCLPCIKVNGHFTYLHKVDKRPGYVEGNIVLVQLFKLIGPWVCSYNNLTSLEPFVNRKWQKFKCPLVSWLPQKSLCLFWFCAAPSYELSYIQDVLRYPTGYTQADTRFKSLFIANLVDYTSLHTR